MSALYRLHRYTDKKGDWRWTLYASNGRKLANCGEGYRRAIDMEKTLRRIFAWLSRRDDR